MEIRIAGTPKEIADLVLEIQGRQISPLQTKKGSFIKALTANPEPEELRRGTAILK